MTANRHALFSFHSRSFLAFSASNGSPDGAFSRQYSSQFRQPVRLGQRGDVVIPVRKQFRPHAVDCNAASVPLSEKKHLH
jgi:hypothetical protein